MGEDISAGFTNQRGLQLVSPIQESWHRHVPEYSEKVVVATLRTARKINAKITASTRRIESQRTTSNEDRSIKNLLSDKKTHWLHRIKAFIFKNYEETDSKVIIYNMEIGFEEFYSKEEIRKPIEEQTLSIKR